MNLYMHTPSAGGVVIHDGKVLLISSARRGSIDLPKGTIEPLESVAETAIREVEEETGYRTRITKDLGSITYDFDGREGKRYRKTVSYFLMELADGDEPVKNLQPGEDFVNQWVCPEDAIRRATYADVRTIITRAFEEL